MLKCNFKIHTSALQETSTYLNTFLELSLINYLIFIWFVFSQKYREFLFAPDDLPFFVLTPKENVFGIGYRGLDRTSVLGNRSTSGHINLFEMPSSSASFGKSGKSDPKNRKGLKISGQAFGIGAYEEEDEDKLDEEAEHRNKNNRR